MKNFNWDILKGFFCAAISCFIAFNIGYAEIAVNTNQESEKALEALSNTQQQLDSSFNHVSDGPNENKSQDDAQGLGSQSDAALDFGLTLPASNASAADKALNETLNHLPGNALIVEGNSGDKGGNQGNTPGNGQSQKVLNPQNLLLAVNATAQEAMALSQEGGPNTGKGSNMKENLEIFRTAVTTGFSAVQTSLPPEMAQHMGEVQQRFEQMADHFANMMEKSSGSQNMPALGGITGGTDRGPMPAFSVNDIAATFAAAASGMSQGDFEKHMGEMMETRQNMMQQMNNNPQGINVNMPSIPGAGGFPIPGQSGGFPVLGEGGQFPIPGGGIPIAGPEGIPIPGGFPGGFQNGFQAAGPVIDVQTIAQGISQNLIQDRVAQDFQHTIQQIIASNPYAAAVIAALNGNLTAAERVNIINNGVPIIRGVEVPITPGTIPGLPAGDQVFLHNVQYSRDMRPDGTPGDVSATFSEIHDHTTNADLAGAPPAPVDNVCPTGQAC